MESIMAEKAENLFQRRIASAPKKPGKAKRGTPEIEAHYDESDGCFVVRIPLMGCKASGSGKNVTLSSFYGTLSGVTVNGVAPIVRGTVTVDPGAFPESSQKILAATYDEERECFAWVKPGSVAFELESADPEEEEEEEDVEEEEEEDVVVVRKPAKKAKRK